MNDRLLLSPYALIFYNEWRLFPDKSHSHIVFDQYLEGPVSILKLDNAIKRFLSDCSIINSHVRADHQSELYWEKNTKSVGLENFGQGFTTADILHYVQQPFDLNQGPLCRFGLLKYDELSYRFFIVFHHIVIDGSSFDFFCDELSNYYNNETYKRKFSENEQHLKTIALFDCLNKKYIANKKNSKIFWQQQLSEGMPVDLGFLKPFFPLEHSSRQTLTFPACVGEERFYFDRGTLEKLTLLRNKFEISPYWFGMSIYALLLYRLTGINNLCITYSTAIKKISGIIYGAQVNSNIIKYNFDHIINFSDLISQTRKFIDAVKHGTIDYSQLSINDILSGENKNFLDVAFIQANLKDNVFGFDGIKPKINRQYNIDLSNKLLFEQEIKNDSVFYRVRYDASKIDSLLLREFIASYQKLFIQILDELHQLSNVINLAPVNRYQLLSSQQYQQIMLDWNRTEAFFHADKTIHVLFEEQVKKTPDYIAAIDGNIKFTYQQLNAEANRLAKYMYDNYFIEPDQLIALCLDRGMCMLISILAVLKAGGAYVPLDPEQPNNRLSYVLTDTKAVLLITQENYSQNFESIAAGVNIVAIDSLKIINALALQSSANLNIKVTSRNLAYVIYTSGTTGKPKGVMIEHSGVVNRIEWMNNQFPLSLQDRILQKTPYFFDVSVWELFWANWYGACVVFAKPAGHKDPDYLIELIQQQSITLSHFVPSMLTLFVEALSGDLPSLRYIFCSGEALNLYQVKACHQRLPKVAVHNLYGPTEASIDVLHYDCTDKTIQTICIGKPIANTVCYILDDHLNPLPIGVVGELYVGGVGLARGYLNNEKLTHEKFISNPFLTGSKLYKTGDLVRRRFDGEIEYIGRKDSQVKINGYRIELSEIESVLLRYKGIKQGIVIVKETRSADGIRIVSSYLVGYYLSEIKIDQEVLLTFLHANLPKYMVPKFLIQLETIPLTHNGKLNRELLPASELQQQKARIFPGNKFELQLCSIIAEIFNLPAIKISMNDNFFALGGDSILAIKLVSKINKVYNSTISIRDVYQSKSLSGLAEIIRLAIGSTHQSEVYIPFSLVNLQDFKNLFQKAEAIEDIYPASYLQAGMLFEASLNNYGTYHDVFVYPIKAKYQEAKVLNIWNTLVRDNALLRSAFVLSANGWNVVVHNKIDLQFDYYFKHETEKAIEKEKSVRFNYQKPGLFKISVNDLGDYFKVIFTFHHAIADGWSVAFLMSEFIKAYIHGDVLPHKNQLSYGEFIKNELSALKNYKVIEFWKNYLSGLKNTKLMPNSLSAKSSDGLNTAVFYLASNEVKSIHRLTQALHISVDMVFLSVYLRLLTALTKVEEGIVGLVMNNRLEKEDGDKLFGLFLNTIPFKYRLVGEKKWRDLLLELFESKNELQSYKQLPYGYIKSLFKSELYNFSFNFTHFHILSSYVDDAESFVAYERTSIPFVLNVSQYKEDTISLRLAAHDHYFDKAFLNDFICQYKKHLADLLHQF